VGIGAPELASARRPRLGRGDDQDVGEPENRSRPVRCGVVERGDGIESPAGTAGGAQFDVYDSMSENTRPGTDVKEFRGTWFPHPVEPRIARPVRPSIFYLLDFIILFVLF